MSENRTTKLPYQYKRSQRRHGRPTGDEHSGDDYGEDQFSLNVEC